MKSWNYFQSIYVRENIYPGISFPLPFLRMWLSIRQCTGLWLSLFLLLPATFLLVTSIFLPLLGHFSYSESILLIPGYSGTCSWLLQYFYLICLRLKVTSVLAPCSFLPCPYNFYYLYSTSEEIPVDSYSTLSWMFLSVMSSIWAYTVAARCNAGIPFFFVLTYNKLSFWSFHRAWPLDSNVWEWYISGTQTTNLKHLIRRLRSGRR